MKFRWLLLVFLATTIVYQPLSAQSEVELDQELLSGLKMRGIGPALMSGRIADIAIHPENPSIWYVAVGSGGVWKTTNSGTSWDALFDDQSSYSVGCVAIDPSNSDVVWVGTGENVSGRHVGYGDGVYRSRDGGLSWKNMGLRESEHIGKILVDPRNSNVIYVAAEGPLWSSGGDRGVFKSEDGGESWENVLQVSDETGATDLEFDPKNPDVIYAATYQRRRTVWALLAGGPESGIYKSTDAGETWRELERGLPKGDMGKIGLAVSHFDPAIVYATIEAQENEAGFYRSSDSGESWEKRNSYISNGTGPHYYQEIYASPHHPGRVYQMDVWLHVTQDGGKTFAELGEKHKHSDNHAMAFHPTDPNYLLVGSDGGLYESFDLGKSWKFISNLPLLQIYKMAVDYDEPFYNVVGGTQDNGTQLGPSQAASVHGILNSDWTVVFGADGYGCQIDPEDPNTIYVEWQNGNLLRYNKQTREYVDIKPQAAQGEAPERWNWDAPILISPHSHTRLYFGSQRLWRSDNRGQSWTPVSGDLSRGENRYELPILGRVRSVDALYDMGAMSLYGNLTTISESPLVEGLIYVGTDDGLIQVTEDGGQSWRKIERIEGVPERAFINDVKASRHDPDTVFAVIDNHKMGDFSPYVVMSSDRGRSWESIVGDLPDRHILWSVEQDHERADLLFLGSEFGIFFTLDGGNKWHRLSAGVPTIAFRDIEIQRRENDLVGASFGRGFYILDDYSPLRELDSRVLEQPSYLFPVEPALRYIPSVDLGVGGVGYQGGSFFSAPNPPFGATFTYYLREPLQTDRERRREREKEIRERGEDVPFPGYDRLEAEARQTEPELLLIIRDGDGEIVGRLTVPAQRGLHRVAWDLRYPAFTPIDISPPADLPPWAEPPAGPLAAPGSYSARLARLVDAQYEPMGEPRAFEVVAMDDSRTLEEYREITAFHLEAGELQRRASAAGEIVQDWLRRLQFIRAAIVQTPAGDPSWISTAHELENRLEDIRKELIRDRVRGRLHEPFSPTIQQRISRVTGAYRSTTEGPTETHRENLEIAARQLIDVEQRLKEIREDLHSLEERLEAAGAPWTPGREIP